MPGQRAGHRPARSSLSISAPGDREEREADAVAERVTTGGTAMNASYRQDARRADVSRNRASAAVRATDLDDPLRDSKGSGRPLPRPVREDMELSFGADFGDVRLHTDRRAERMNDVIHALAFTHGKDVYFNAGRYRSSTASGRHLLAHELAHVVQQAGGHDHIHRVPNPAPPPDPYIEGRPAHNHPALGVWPAVQANARAVCARETTTVTPPAPLPQIPIPVSTTKLGKAECACAILTPLQVLAAARTIEMSGQPLAIAHLDHYISGGGVDFLEHTNLDDLMNQDPGARGVISTAIARADRGHVFIQQHHYSSENFKRAFGGIDRVDYQVDRAAGTVDVWFKDRYDFHPAGFGHLNMGAGDMPPPGRVTNCVHLAAVEAKSSGAADYWMIGHATLPLSLFTGSSAAPAPGAIE